MPPNNPDVFCVAPFIHASLESDDKLLPCCIYKIPDDQKVYHVHEFDQWWNQGLAGLRQDMLAGRENPGCAVCYRNEREGIPSIRKSFQELFPQYLDIQEPLASPTYVMAGIGNHCNLTCVFCSPLKSSAWGQLYEDNADKFIKFRMKIDEYPRGSWSQEDQAEQVLRDLMPHATWIHYAGGEPLLTPIHRRVLAEVPDPSKVQLTINTSLESLSEEWIDVMSQFKTRIQVSLESASPINDYIRAGSNWNQVHTNILRLKQRGIKILITHVLSRTSCWTLPGVIDFCIEHDFGFFWHRLDWPISMQIRGATVEERSRILNISNGRNLFWGRDGFEQLQNFVRDEPYDAELDREFWQYIDLQDQLQNRNFRQLCNEYAP